MSAAQPPFDGFTFWMIQGNLPRVSLNLARLLDDSYELHVAKGSAANPTFTVTRAVPLATAVRLNEALVEANASNWEEAYGDAPGAQPLRWGMTITYKKDVFSVTSKGGSATPAGFNRVLDELYRMDMPRPPASAQGVMPAQAVDLGGLDMGFDMDELEGLGEFDIEELAKQMQQGPFAGALSQMRSNPTAFLRLVRDEFRGMPYEEQERMLDQLASTGMATRAWWERWLRG